MKRTSHAEALERLKEQQRKLQERANKIHARMRKQDRAVNTRRKVLAGAFLFEWMERDPEIKRRAMTGFDGYLKRDIDRQHFDLELRGGRSDIEMNVPTTEDDGEKKAI